MIRHQLVLKGVNRSIPTNVLFGSQSNRQFIVKKILRWVDKERSQIDSHLYFSAKPLLQKVTKHILGTPSLWKEFSESEDIYRELFLYMVSKMSVEESHLYSEVFKRNCSLKAVSEEINVCFLQYCMTKAIRVISFQGHNVTNYSKEDIQEFILKTMNEVSRQRTNPERTGLVATAIASMTIETKLNMREVMDFHQQEFPHTFRFLNKIGFYNDLSNVEPLDKIDIELQHVK